MVVIMKAGFTTDQLESAVKAMEAGGVKVMVSKGSETTILGAEGDASRIDQEKVSMLPGVDRVMRVSEPYKKANRKYHPDNTVIDLGNSATVGGDRLCGHRRALLRGERGADRRGGRVRETERGGRAAGRCLQTPHLTLRLPGHGQRGDPSPPGGQGGHRTAHCDGDHVHRQHRDVRDVRGRHPGGRPEHAEF